MPPVARWSLRSALICLVFGLPIGGLLLAWRGARGVVVPLLPLHVEIVLVGWLMQLTFAAAYWIFPRFAGGTSRGNERTAWISLVALNAGLLLTVAGDVGLVVWWVAVGGALQFVGVLAFVLHVWPRVKPFSKPRGSSEDVERRA